jgi:hypothetical protein
VVAEDVLERLVPRIADAAMDLHRPVRRFADQPVRPVIAHRDLVGEFALDLAVLHPVHLPRGLADQQAQHLAWVASSTSGNWMAWLRARSSPNGLRSRA